MSIQDAIDAAPPGGTVNVPPGTYNEQLVIYKPLTLTGPEPEDGEAIIDASGMPLAPTINITSSDVTVKLLTIQNGPTQGILVGSSSFPNLTGVVIENNIIRGHGNAGIMAVYNAAVRIVDNLIENNGLVIGFGRVGIYLETHGTSQVIGNVIRSNAQDGIFARSSSSGLLIQDNDIQGHSLSGITLAWDQKNTTITGNQISNNGSGTRDEQGGIVIIQSMAEVIKDNTIVNCNRSGIFWGWVPTTGPAPDQILIRGNHIEGSVRDAIYLFSQGPGGFIPPDAFPLEPLIIGNALLSSGRAGVYVSNFYYFSPGNARPTIHYNDISGNQWGVYNATARTVDAINNWWGDPSGPFHPLLNPLGSGDRVSDRVDFIPWLGKPPLPVVLECATGPATLERYFVTPLPEGKAKVFLKIRVPGTVLVEYLGGQLSTEFSALFYKEVIMYVPRPDVMVPTIDAISRCRATPIGMKELVVGVDLCITIDVAGAANLLIPAFGYYPEPAVRLEPQGGTIPSGISAGNRSNGTPAELVCINTIKIFDSCYQKDTEVILVTITD